MNLFLLIIGLIFLILGAELIIRGSVSFGKKLNVSLFAIGVVIVAGGTSLPELASSINAVVSNHADLAVGAVVGSNIANLILVMAATSFLVPIDNINQNQINQAWINIFLAIVLIIMNLFILPFNFLFGILSIVFLFCIMFLQVKQGTLDVSEVEEKGDYSLFLSITFIVIGIILFVVGALVTNNKNSLYFCKHCKLAFTDLADLYNHSVKEHDDDDVEGIQEEAEYEAEEEVEEAEYEAEEEVEKLKTRNPYIAKGVIIGLVFVILFIPFFVVVSDFVYNIYIMQNDKMSPLIEKNDWVSMSDTPISEINSNDIIFYQGSDTLLLHQVVGRETYVYDSSGSVDYVLTVKNTVSSDKTKVTEEQYLGKMDFVIGNGDEFGKTMYVLVRIIFNPVMIIPWLIIGMTVPLFVMRRRATINV